MAQGDTYLTTEEAAAYLKLKPRKLYELASEGAVPCSKATGKWLFPRAALDRWVAAGLAMPAGLAPAEPPPIVGGSHDPLLEWALRRASAGLALLPEGSGAGLTRLARDEVMIAAIHLHAAAHAPDEDANAAAVRALPGLHDAVVIGFARREQGLVLAPDHAEGIDGVTAAARAGLRIGQRQAGAGAQALFERLCGQAGLAQDALRLVSRTYPTGNDLALAIRAGEIDGGLATRAVARLHGLAFRPLVWEAFDLVMRRRTYFEPPAQALLAVLRLPDFTRQAEAFGGYELGQTGAVRLNG